MFHTLYYILGKSSPSTYDIYYAHNCPSHATNDMQKRILCELSRSTYSHTRRTIRFSREAHLFKTDICPRLLFSSFYSFFFPQINNNIN